ncbi:MAG: hypothetical protein ACKPKO_11570, partial [Candidatus Fonsibacter sp.]
MPSKDETEQMQFQVGHSYPLNTVAMRPFRQHTQVASDATVVQLAHSPQVGGPPRSPLSFIELNAVGDQIHVLSVEICGYQVQRQFVLAHQSNREALLVLQGMQDMAIA